VWCCFAKFVSDDDLNARVAGWLDKVANVRVHGTLKERPVDRFEVEKAPEALGPLALPARVAASPRPIGGAGRRGGGRPVRRGRARRPLADYARIAGGVR